ncbi:hypothetical protein D3C78_1239040 [compost metagenome]
MKIHKLAVIATALLLSACGKEADVCAGSDVQAQLVKVFTDGPLAGHASLLKQSELKDVAILEKDADTGVLQCVATLSATIGPNKVEGPLLYRIAPVAKSEYDYLLLDTQGDRTVALADKVMKAFKK